MIKSCICGSNQRSKKDKKPVVDRLAIGAGFKVVCQNCGNESPIANYEDEAIYFWNEIIKACIASLAATRLPEDYAKTTIPLLRIR